VLSFWVIAHHTDARAHVKVTFANGVGSGFVWVASNFWPPLLPPPFGRSNVGLNTLCGVASPRPRFASVGRSVCMCLLCP
jgi:hypothetical protein